MSNKEIVTVISLGEDMATELMSFVPIASRLKNKMIILRKSHLSEELIRHHMRLLGYRPERYEIISLSRTSFFKELENRSFEIGCFFGYGAQDIKSSPRPKPSYVFSVVTTCRRCEARLSSSEVELTKKKFTELCNPPLPDTEVERVVSGNVITDYREDLCRYC